MNKTVKIVLIMVAILGILLISSNGVFAANGPINPATDLQAKYGETGEMTNVAGKIMGLIRNIAVIAGVIMLMIIGVKYIFGSVEEKADYKKSLMPLVIGILLVMAATTIVSFIFNFMG